MQTVFCKSAHGWEYKKGSYKNGKTRKNMERWTEFSIFSYIIGHKNMTLWGEMNEFNIWKTFGKCSEIDNSLFEFTKTNTSFISLWDERTNLLVFLQFKSAPSEFGLSANESICLDLRGHIHLKTLCVGKPDKGTDVLWVLRNPNNIWCGGD